MAVVVAMQVVVVVVMTSPSLAAVMCHDGFPLSGMQKPKRRRGFAPRMPEPPMAFWSSHGRARRWSSSWQAFPSEKEPSAAATTTTTAAPRRRREKKNKYSQFSKVERRKQNPLEELMAESQRKRAALEKPKTKAERPGGWKLTSNDDVAKSRPTLHFPEAETIDPYDPTTYGYVELGTILGAHGVHGQVKLRCVSDFGPARLCPPSPVVRYLKLPHRRAPRSMVLRHGRSLGGENDYLVQLQGVTTRNDAAKLRGAILYARNEDDGPPSLQQDEYLVTDLVGLDVYLQPDYMYTAGVVLDRPRPGGNQRQEEEEAEEEEEEEQETEEEEEEDENKDEEQPDKVDMLQDQDKGDWKQEKEQEDLEEEEEDKKPMDDDDDDTRVSCKLPRRIFEGEEGRGAHVGTVHGVVLGQDLCRVPGLGQDLLEVALRPDASLQEEEEELVLIPFVPQLVPEVDLEQKAIFIRPPPGLLDLTYLQRQGRVRIKGYLPPAQREPTLF